MKCNALLLWLLTDDRLATKEGFVALFYITTLLEFNPFKNLLVLLGLYSYAGEKWHPYFNGAKPTLKILLASLAFYTVFKGFRILNAENLGSVGQRAAKLPTIKV